MHPAGQPIALLAGPTIRRRDYLFERLAMYDWQAKEQATFLLAACA